MIIETNSKSSKTKLALVGSNSTELLSQFRNKEAWMSDGKNAGGMIRLLGEHATDYFSPLRAAFLFQFQSPDALAYFSPVLARDGAMTLLHYFLHHPNPSDPNQVLIVDQSLQNLIPASWGNNCLTYSLKSTARTPKRRAKLILISSTLGSRQFKKSSFPRENISNYDFSEIIWITSASETIFDPSAKENVLNYNSELLLEAAKWDIPIKFESFSNLQGQDLTDSHFLDLNDLHFFYGNSFIVNTLMQQGSLSLEVENLIMPEIIERVPLSFYHELQIFDSGSGHSVIDKKLDEFRKSDLLFLEEKKHDPKKISFNQKICSPSFENFAFHLSKEFLDF